MSGRTAAPSAWDDDWQTIADKKELAEKSADATVKILSKAERKAQHVEANKQLWQSAETPQKEPIFLHAKQDEPPLATDFKPALKVLSRKPAVPTAGSRAYGGGGDDDDSEEEERRRAAVTFAERQARAQREREEKQRKYQEARERIFNSGPVARPGSSSSNAVPAAVTGAGASATEFAPASPRGGGAGRNLSRGKGRGRGGGGGGGIGGNGIASAANTDVARPQEQSPARSAAQRRLFDPGYAEKPGSAFVARERTGGGSRPSTPGESQHLRSPKGPDGTGRGGFGFAGRGGIRGTSSR